MIGGDIHVYVDGLPVYVLENWRPAPDPDPEWRRELPSRMLSARHEIVRRHRPRAPGGRRGGAAHP
ncbi:hypothetical protein OG523_06075 [Streptomyces virginiae]|uniref:hypothetical protein n=1 Tax=Streptomyces virginiae TaxID=1961 RepID=UPI002E34A3F2|nr:hypothetical protein [Streptomyces virginiae]